MNPAMPAQVINATQIPRIDAALTDLTRILNAVPQLRWGVHGGCAARIRGANVRPTDIDVLVSLLAPARTALVESGLFRWHQGRPGGVITLIHLPSNTEVDIADIQDFLPSFSTSDVHTVQVFTLTEVIIGLIRRPQQREKDQNAFALLVLQNESVFSEAQKINILKAAQGVIRGITWEGLVDNARVIAKTRGLI